MDLINQLAVGRLALGSTLLVAPSASARLGLLPSGAPTSSLLTRLFAAREIALGGLTLLAPAEHRARVVQVGIAVDAADALAGVSAIRAGEADAVRGMGFVAIAAGAVALGVASVVTES